MEFVDIPKEKSLRRQFLKTTFLYLLALSQKVKNVFYFTHLFVHLFVFFSVLSSVHTHTYARAYSWNFEKYVFFYFPENIVSIKWGWLINFSQLTAAFSFVFIYWKIPAENVGNGISETGPKLKNFLGSMVL